MNLQSEHSNLIDFDICKPNFTSLYINDRGSNGSSSRTYSGLQRDRDDEEILKSFYSSEGNGNCDKIRTTHRIICPYYTDLQSETQNNSEWASSDSAYSRYLDGTTKYHCNDTKCNEIRTNQCRNDIKNKFEIPTKVTLLPSHQQVRGKYGQKNQEKLHFDKTTYCRPVHNIYNQRLLYKTIEKNAKLQRLVKELIVTRRKEKDTEHWNNYINNLRTKHCSDIPLKMGSATSLQYISGEFGTLDNIEDLCNTTFKCKTRNPCQNLLQEFYKAHHVISPHEYQYTICNKNAQIQKRCNLFEKNGLCYPTNSQGKLIMLERERMTRLINRDYNLSHNIGNEEKSKRDIKIINRAIGSGNISFVCRNRSTNTIPNYTSPVKYTQTDLPVSPIEDISSAKNEECNLKNTDVNNDTKQPCSQKVTLDKLIITDNNNLNQTSLACIEEKIDNIIYSINNFMIELKKKKVEPIYSHQYTRLRKRNISYTRSDSCDMATKEKFVCGLINGSNSSRTTKRISEDNFSRMETIDGNSTRMNEFLVEEIGKNKVIALERSSVTDIYRPCSVKISVTIPTKEIATEVTRSLSKAVSSKHQSVIIEEIPRGQVTRIAMAVNTDPLSLLSMLRVSTEETLKRLLSFVPAIDYYYYLSRLSTPIAKDVDAQYICNICGAAFTKPSALTNHIQIHNLGPTRDCCVCRHVLDMPRRRAGLFKCQYCGQRFTRAYCCELHQETCARRLGKVHDVASNLILLR